jgi:hypothetical protein
MVYLYNNRINNCGTGGKTTAPKPYVETRHCLVSTCPFPWSEMGMPIHLIISPYHLRTMTIIRAFAAISVLLMHNKCTASAQQVHNKYGEGITKIPPYHIVEKYSSCILKTLTGLLRLTDLLFSLDFRKIVTNITINSK